VKLKTNIHTHIMWHLAI